MAKNDSTARDFLAGKLPSLIVDRLPPLDGRTASPVWLNAVRLAGQLKIVEAVPALTQALSRPQMCGAYDSKGSGCSSSTFATDARLDNDIVGRALADIGDPSVPVLADILSKGDFRARLRAIWILWNINSPAAQKAMRDHLPSESDPQLSGLIEKSLLHVPQ
jgi:HEAT repeat protein